METIRVRINDDGVTAREINSFGEKHPLENTYMEGELFNGERFVKTKININPHVAHESDVNQWQQAEAALRNFAIDWIWHNDFLEATKYGYDVIHTASILPNGKIKILD